MDWIKHGWGKNFSDQIIKNEFYYIDTRSSIFTDNKSIIYSFKNIEKITHDYPSPYYVLVSGGIDSQAQAWAWKLSGVPHTIISFRYDETFNQHDLINFNYFAEKFGLKVEYIDLKLLDFFENQLELYAIKYNCGSPQICTHMLFREHIPNGTIIFSGCPILGSSPELDYTILGLTRYKNYHNSNIVPSFFCYSPELAGSFENTYELIRKTRNKSLYETKYKTYWETGFPVIPQKTKLSGFEEYKNYYDKTSIPVLWKLKYANKPSKRIFDILFRYKISDRLNLPKDCIILS